MVPAGWFGKLPALGDFASRRLPQEFIQPWDSWLQQVVAGSQTILGERWLDTYLTSHIWRFVLAEDCLDSHAWAGILVPSVDRVGRYFPLCIAAELTPDGVTSGWFEALEDCARLALGSVEVDTFDAALMAIPAAETGSAVSADLIPLLNTTVHFSADTIQPILAGTCPKHSAWCVGINPDRENSFLLPGMPDTATYVAMLQRS